MQRAVQRIRCVAKVLGNIDPAVLDRIEFNLLALTLAVALALLASAAMTE